MAGLFVLEVRTSHTQKRTPRYQAAFPNTLKQPYELIDTVGRQYVPHQKEFDQHTPKPKEFIFFYTMIENPMDSYAF